MTGYRIGNDMTILWSINDRTGAALPLNDKEVHLYYTCERGRFEADIEIQDQNVVVWRFMGKQQRCLGGYTLTLVIIGEGKRTIKKDYCNAFTLVGRGCRERFEKDAHISEGGELTLASELDIYRIYPVIPVVGPNSNWWVDGEDTGDPSTGMSAYEYALTKGFEGTEEEFAQLTADIPNTSRRLGILETNVGEVISNAEYIRAYTDSKGTFLWGIRNDGSIEFAKGVPTPIREYVARQLSQFSGIIEEIAALRQEVEENAKEFTEAYEELDKKIESIGIIVSNAEWVYAITDNDGVVLLGIRYDGTVVMPKSEMATLVEETKEQITVLETQVDSLKSSIKALDDKISTIGDIVSDKEWLYAIVDKEGVVLLGIRYDGTVVMPKSEMAVLIEDIIKRIDSLEGKIEGEGSGEGGEENESNQSIKELADKLDSIAKVITNKEWLYAIIDTEDVVLMGIRYDGTVVMPKSSLTEFQKDIEAQISTIETGKFEDDFEQRLEMTMDSEGGIVSYRDKKGVKVENVGIRTKSLKIEELTLGENGMSKLVAELSEKGVSGRNDLSKEANIIIPMPQSLVKVKITADRFPDSKDSDISGFLEFMDMHGNYFKKAIEALAWQGSTSLGAPKKNLKFDFVDCDMKVGSWVVQDSFHLKANYFDIFRGKSNLAYDLWRKIIEFKRPSKFRKPYIDEKEYSYINGSDNTNYDFSEARLTPAGFPIALYFNDEYLGIYTWNIKKDRGNYAMKKNNPDHIHIDPEYVAYLIGGQYVPWGEFEIRNPKSLVTMDGAEYDGDAPAELIDATSANYNSSDSSHITSAQVKNHIEEFRLACADVMLNRSKETFERYFDPEWFTDFLIWGNAVLDGDGLARNTQYLFWGKKWYMAPYDCDQIFGNNWRGNYIYQLTPSRKVDERVHGENVAIYGVFLDLYKDEIDARYKELREANILSSNSIIQMISSYAKMVGMGAYEKELELWPETPCYRTPNDNLEWQFSGDYYEGEVSEWNASKSYLKGQYVSMIVEGDTYYWKCLIANKGIQPYYNKYQNAPIVGGFYDSLTRTEIWLEKRFEFLDNHFNFK